MKMTAKQEKFVQELVRIGNQRKAYINAGYSTKGKSGDYIDCQASKLAKNTKVLQRYNELKKEIDDKIHENLVWDKNRAYTELLELLEDSKVDKQYNQRLGAIKELNNLADLYPRTDNAPTELKVTVDVAGVTEDDF